MLKGDLGQPPGGWPEALQKKALKGEKRLDRAPRLAAQGRRSRGERPRTPRRSSGASSPRSRIRLLPDVSEGLLRLRRAQETYGPVRVLPTPTYFYGMKPGDEIFVDIEKGKTLVVRYQAIGETDERAWSPCSSNSTASRAASRCRTGPWRRRDGGAAQGRVHRSGQCRHVGAPMPGVVGDGGGGFRAGQKVKAGDVLLTIEAMKMETAHPCRARRHVAALAVLVKAGDQIDAKDLLVHQ
jgi:pyruvate carboxylase